MALNMDVEAEVERLVSLGLPKLRDAWPRRFGLPPLIRSPDLLRRLLAWKLQEEAYGGLDAETRRLLARKAVVERGPRLGAGARLVREWKGERHEAEVNADGTVLYRGDTFASLSEVARAITGSRWNGPRFFGLRGAA
ncbi:DUF2924 domain-containing protein [soil metagenome]